MTGPRSVTGERARLFTALELPSDAVTVLTRWADEHLNEVPGLRRLAAAGLHVTLCFLGSRPVGEIEPITGVCSALAGRGPVALRVGAPVWLPPRRPRALAVALEDRDGALAGLQSELARALEQGGWYEPERRRFLAHVTIGRFGRAGRAGGSGGAGGRALDLPGPSRLSFSGASVALMRSHPGPGGTRYERLARVPLGT